MKDSAVPNSAPEAKLTSDAIEQLKALKPKVGHSRYDLAVPAIARWNTFWKKGVSQWAGDVLVYDTQSKPERMLLGTEFLINQNVHVAGSLAFDWVLFGESMKRFHEAKVATTSVAASPSAYYPPTSGVHGRRRRGVQEVGHAHRTVLPQERL